MHFTFPFFSLSDMICQLIGIVNRIVDIGNLAGISHIGSIPKWTC